MKRRSILAALAAAPLALFASTAQALGRRRGRRCCEPSGGPLRGASVVLDINKSGPSGMEVYDVTVTVHVTLENTAGVAKEIVGMRGVEATLYHEGDPTPIVTNGEFMKSTAGLVYTFTKGGLQLVATDVYRADVTVHIDKESYADDSHTAP